MPQVRIHLGTVTHRLDSSADASLLDDALAHGVAVGYSCRRGDCGQCIATLQSGEARAINPAQAFRRGGDIYLCNAAATSDLDLRLPYFPELDDIPSIRSPAKIHALRRLSGEVIEVSLRLPPATTLRFLPGQFVRLTNKERTRRSYSLAAGPADDQLIRLHVRRVADGAFSAYLFERARPGDLLHLEGPQGHFFLRREQRYEKTVFLATGTGIAPIYAMLASLRAAQRPALGEIDVYWGNRQPSDEYLADELKTLSGRIGFRYWPIHSQGGSADGAVRHVQELMARQHGSLAGAAAFACGSPAMIDAARIRCVQLGMALDRFHSDPFTVS